MKQVIQRLRSWEALLFVILIVVVAINISRSPNYLTLNNQINLFQLYIEKIIVEKLQHDIAGHYNRFDVLSLNLNRRPQRAIWEMYTGEDPGYGEGKETEGMKEKLGA